MARKPKSAFGAYVRDNLTSAVRNIAFRMHRAVPITWTGEELARAITLPEDIDVLRRAAKIVDFRDAKYVDVVMNPNWSGANTYGTAHLTCIAGVDFPLPRYARQIGISSLPSELEARMRSYWDRRLQIGRDWQEILQLVEELDTACSEPMAVRVIFPGIVMLLQELGSKRAEELQHVRVPKNIPQVSPELRAFVKRADGLLAASRLIEDTPDVPFPSFYHVPSFESSFIFTDELDPHPVLLQPLMGS